MPKQPAFPGLRDAMKKKVTRRKQFLTEMEAVVPWGWLLALIATHYPKVLNFFGCRPQCKRFLTVSVRVIDCVLLSGLFSAALPEAAAGMVISGSGPNLRQGLEGRS